MKEIRSGFLGSLFDGFNDGGVIVSDIANRSIYRPSHEGVPWRGYKKAYPFILGKLLGAEPEIPRIRIQDYRHAVMD